MLADLLDRARRAAISSSSGRRGRCRRSTARSPAATRSARAPRPRPRRSSISTILRVVLPRTIESSTTTTRWPATSASGLNFSLIPCCAQRLVGLDERAADVAVLDQPLAERDPGRAREADRGRRARVGDRQHEVGLDRRLRGEPLAHAHARAVHLDAVEPRVGPGEVEELEDAERAVLGGRRRPGSSATPSSSIEQQLAGRDLALAARRRRGRARRSRRRRPGSPLDAAEHERPEAVRVAEGEQLAVGERRRPSTRRRAAPSRSATRLARAAPGRSRSARRSPRCRRSTRA